MNLSRAQILAEMGVTPLWRLREADVACTVPMAVPQVLHSKPPVSTDKIFDVEDIGRLDWDSLEQAMASCQACPLFEHRRQVVPGVGDRQASWLFIGEGPGAEEEAQGEPFVGQAGKLLDNMLLALGLKRSESVYISNAIKCRPPGNRAPENVEISSCAPFLERQIALIAPRVIVLLGRTAVHSILREERGSLASLRGKHFQYKGIPVVVTYHPAYLLRNLPEKAKVWEDLLFAQDIMKSAQTPSLL